MSNITGSRGFNSAYRGSNAPGAFYAVFTGDFGEPAPAAPSLTYHAGSGSLATGTAHVKVTWITAEGISLPSVDAAVQVSASTGAVTVAQPTVPTNGATVIGWQIYSQGSATTALNTTGTAPAPAPIATSEGPETGFPVATTSVLLEAYGTGGAVPTIDASGAQPALPSVPASGTATAAGGSADYYFIVPNSGSQWKNYKVVGVERPDSVVETAGISASYPFDCQSPLYPGATPGAATYTQVSVAPGTYMVMNGILFVASQTGSQNTAATFVGAAAFQNIAKGSTVTDGSVIWTSLGRATLVHARFENTGNAAAIPAAQEYDLMQF